MSTPTEKRPYYASIWRKTKNITWVPNIVLTLVGIVVVWGEQSRLMNGEIMRYLSTPAAVELARSMDVQGGSSLYAVFEGFRHRGVALDANLRSALDGFAKKTRDDILDRLLHEADKHHTVMAAFTKEDVYLEKFSTVSGGRKLMLWQDIADNRDNLYAAANAAQQLLSNLGYNRYAPDLLTKNTSMEVQQKSSIVHFLKAVLKVGHSTKGVGVTAEKGVNVSTSREVSQNDQAVYEESSQHTGGWEYAMPYFRELGEKLDLIPPQTLLAMSSDQSVDDAITHNTLDETYQRLRSTEVILLKAVNAALPDSMKEDKKLRFLLDNGYVGEALQRLLAKEKIVFNGDDSPYQKKIDGELSWTIHAVLYAALYRGARQRIEDTSVEYAARAIHEMPDMKKKALSYSVKRDYGDYIPEDGWAIHTGNTAIQASHADELRKLAKWTSQLSLPIHIIEDNDKLVITGWPELCSNGFNCTHPFMAAASRSSPDLYDIDVFTPVDAVMLNIPKNMDTLRSGYTKGMLADIQKNIDAIIGTANTHKMARLKA